MQLIFLKKHAMQIKSLIIIVVFNSLLAFHTYGSEQNLFSKLSVDEGLSQSTVFDIVQDSLGYMWFATQDGLNRYDGSKFTVFRMDEKDPSSIAFQYIRSLFVDSKNDLWAGGKSIISRYSYNSDCFENYHILSQDNDDFISCILSDNRGDIWAATQKGVVYVYERKKNTFQKLSLINNKNYKLSIEKMIIVGDDFYLCGLNGLYKFNSKNRVLTEIKLVGRSIALHDIIVDKNKEFWLATADEGVYSFDSNFNLISNYKNYPGINNTLINNKVRSLSFDKQGILWIGTFAGLSILDPKKQQFDNYIEDSKKPNSLSHNSIRSIFTDKSNGIWIGTFFGGVSYYHRDNIKFYNINKNSGPIALKDNIVNALTLGKDNSIWIGYNDYGLSRLNLNTNTIQHLKTPTDIINIKTILSLNDGSLLIGTHWGGLNHFNPKTGISKSYKKTDTPNSILDNRVSTLLLDKQNNVWVGTYAGLQRFDLSTGKFYTFNIDVKGQKISSEAIFCMLEDSHQRLWVGTFNGLNMYYPEVDLYEIFTNSVKEKKSISNNLITCVYEDKKKRIWVGTSNGLNLFDEVNRTFKRFNTHNGLGNNFINAILEDDDDNLWITSNNVLMKFNTNTFTCQNFSKKDGLQSSQFNQGVATKLPNGYMLFCGINGITYFSPKDISNTVINYNVLFTDLMIFDKHIRPNDEFDILKSHISKTEKIKLNYNQNYFTIGFSAINYNKYRPTYKYKLDGLHSEWQSTSDNYVTFSNLPSGNYKLHVKVDRADNDEDKFVKSLEIVIRPPWWRTIWMYIVYLIVLILLIRYFYKNIQERIRMTNELALEKMEIQKMEELNELKLQFFLNISHEFKTPLTLILSPLEKLLKSKMQDQWQSRQVEIVYRNAQLLLSLIDQLIEFRKSEINAIELNVKKGNLTQALHRIFVAFQVVSKNKNIKYTFETDNNDIYIYFDNNIIERIFFNLISNSFKFTPFGGSIICEIRSNNDNVIVTVKDTGRGIPNEKIDKIFDQFYTTKNQGPVGGSGIGLNFTKRLVEIHHGIIQVSSELGKGSIFTVKLPINDDVYKPSEIDIVETEINQFEQSSYITAAKLMVDIPLMVNSADSEDTILIVDDSPDMVGYLLESFSTEYNVDVAYDGAKALEMINNKMYSLIISDVMMPEVNGLVLCKKIKQNINTCHIPVILLTASSDSELELKGFEIGADDYISKPFSLTLLETKVRNIIRSRKRLKEIYKESIALNPEQVAFNQLDQEFLANAAGIIEKQMSDSEFSVDKFAQEMFMSRSNLHLKFKAITGESASDFIKKMRFQKSIELLKTQKYTISEVSYMVGFSTPSYFSAAFKKHFGYFPNELKKGLNAQ